VLIEFLVSKVDSLPDSVPEITVLLHRAAAAALVLAARSVVHAQAVVDPTPTTALHLQLTVQNKKKKQNSLAILLVQIQVFSLLLFVVVAFCTLPYFFC
jgi:hypothetical protein